MRRFCTDFGPQMRLTFLSLLLTLVLAKAAQAQIPAPESFLKGYTQQFTPHHRLVDYYRAVDAASDRVTVEQYGETYEGRPLILAYVSSAANLARLEELRLDHLRRSGVLEGAASAKTQIAVVWLSYSVHGNEAAGSEASPQVLYDLATGQPSGQLGLTADSLERYLANTIIVLDPSLNPDGYSRYTDHVRRRSSLALQPAPSAWEHDEPWPGGRTNHYYFDLNRDWAWATQQETQARLAVYRRWMPHVHADLHEMGVESSYYFAPAAEPYHRYISEHQRRFQQDIGRNHAAIFDQQGWLYYTREIFDLLYPSYGDTYPTFNGAIGMTYEQSGSGRAGRAILRNEGDTLTLADRIAHHHATSLSTIAVASRNAARLAEEMAAYRRNAKGKARSGIEGYLFPAATNDPGRLASLRRLLDLHGITYGSPTQGRKVNASDYSGRAASYTSSPQDLVVPTAQAQGILAQVLLDPESEVPDSLTYDITAWSLPLVMGLDARTLREAPGQLEAFAKTPAAPARRLDANTFALAVPFTGLQSWEALAPLLQQGLVARVSPSAAKFGNATLPAGTLYLMRRDNAGSASPNVSPLQSAYDSLSASGVRVEVLNAGFLTEGFDLGSDAVQRITAPTVVLVQDDELDENTFGHVWHFFEQRLGYPIRPVPWSMISARSLADVDVVIVTNGQPSLSGSNAEALDAWVRAGGRLIALEGAAEHFGKREGFGLKEKEAPAKLEIAGSEPDPMLPYAERERRSIASNNPGVLVTAQVDTTHPLGFGLPKEISVLRVGQRNWTFLKDGGQNVIGIRKDPEVRGFVGSGIVGELDETLAVGVQPLGLGSIVYAADNLAYRGFWEIGMQVLANAVFLR